MYETSDFMKHLQSTDHKYPQVASCIQPTMRGDHNMQRTVFFMCSCAQVSRWSGGHEETNQRSCTRVRQTIDRTPSTPGKTRSTRYMCACKYQTTKILCINSTECFLFFYLFHRISRVLQTKRISNHRNTATILRCCFIRAFLVTLELDSVCRMLVLSFVSLSFNFNQSDC